MAVLICAIPAAASWRTRFLSPSEGGGAAAVAVDGAGDVVAAGGRLSPTDAGAVAKYDGADGAEVWRGATVRLVNPLTLESATLAIPGGAGWTAIGNPPGSKGWRYRDLTGAGGPCKSALARPGKLKALCQGTQGPIPFSLDEPSQGTLVFSLQLGSAAPQCATFGGTIRRDQGAGAPGETGYFLAAEAPPAPGGCP